MSSLRSGLLFYLHPIFHSFDKSNYTHLLKPCQGKNTNYTQICLKCDERLKMSKNHAIISGSDQKAILKYHMKDFTFIKIGTYVFCAQTGKRIELVNLATYFETDGHWLVQIPIENID